MATVYAKRYVKKWRNIYIVANDNLCHLVDRIPAGVEITDEMCQKWIDEYDFNPLKSMMNPPEIESGLDKIYEDQTKIKKQRYRHGYGGR